MDGNYKQNALVRVVMHGSLLQEHPPSMDTQQARPVGTGRERSPSHLPCTELPLPTSPRIRPELPVAADPDSLERNQKLGDLHQSYLRGNGSHALHAFHPYRST